MPSTFAHFDWAFVGLSERYQPVMSTSASLLLWISIQSRPGWRAAVSSVVPLDAMISLMTRISDGGITCGRPLSGSSIDSFIWNTIVGLSRNAPSAGANVTATKAPCGIA